jgi:uncharacterized protein (UPF0548 family)
VTRPMALGDPTAPAGQSSAVPAGYSYRYRCVRVGHGPEDYQAAREVVLGWGMQRRAGAEVYPAGVQPEEGLTVLVTTRVGPIVVTAPCRVVWTVDDGERAGFGYGTLPGHPVRGEEAFLVHRDQTGDVWATVLAFSRPAAWYARIAGPLLRLSQRWVTTRYLRAFR